MYIHILNISTISIYIVILLIFYIVVRTIFCSFYNNTLLDANDPLGLVRH